MHRAQVSNRLRRFVIEDWALLFVLVYFLVQIALVTWVSNGAGLDDAEQLAYIGPLQRGYGGSQPPLYTWVSSIASSVFGLRLFTLQLVKFGLLASIYISVYCGARLLGLSNAVAAAGMLAIFLLPPIGWESQRALTHSVAGMAGCAWAFVAFAWHMRSRSWLSAALWGLGMAAALLGKFNAGFFVAALLVTGLLVPDYRKVILSRTSLLTLAVFVAALLPTALWMLDHRQFVLARSGKLALDQGGGFLAARIAGAGQFVNAVLLWAVILALFGIAVARNRSDWLVQRRPQPVGTRFSARLVIWSLGFVFLAIIVSGATRVEVRWLQPVMFLAPLAVSSWLAGHLRSERALRQVAFWSAVVAVIYVPVLAYSLHYNRAGDPPIGQLDYAALYNRARQAGDFRTVLSDKPQLPGNLRLFDPTLVAIHFEMPDAAAKVHRPLLVVWFDDHAVPGTVRKILDASGLALPQASVVDIDLPYVTQPNVTEAVHFAILP